MNYENLPKPDLLLGFKDHRFSTFRLLFLISEILKRISLSIVLADLGKCCVNISGEQGSRSKGEPQNG